MKLRPKIDAHDYETKKGHVVRFLRASDKVKITIMFRGREQHRPELGYRLLQRLAEDVTELGFVESSPKQDGRNMVMVLGPHKKKADAKVDMKAEESKAAERAALEADERAERDAARGPDRWRRRRSGVAPRISTPRSKPDPPRRWSGPPAQAVVEPCRDHPAPSRGRRCRRTRRTPVPASASA